MPMKRPKKKIFLPLFAVLLHFVLLFSQAANFQTARVRRVGGGEALLLTNGERVRLIGVDTLELRESKKLYRDVKESGRADCYPTTGHGIPSAVWIFNGPLRKGYRL